MRQLNINNLRLSIDATGDNAEKEAHRVLEMINKAIAYCDGDPALLIVERLEAEYEDVADKWL